MSCITVEIVKILIDENLPPIFFRELPKILKISNLEIKLVQEEYGQGVSDIAWFEKYANDGGRYFLSDDKAIRKKKQEYRAYQDCELTGIFMPKEWSHLPRNEKATLIFVKWLVIMDQFKRSKSRQMFMLKYNMNPRSNSFTEIGS